MFIGASVLTGALKLHNTYCYLFPTGFELTRGYGSDHLLNHKELLQIVSDKSEIYHVVTF